MKIRPILIELGGIVLKKSIGESILAVVLGLAVVAVGTATFLLWKESGNASRTVAETNSETAPETTTAAASSYYEVEISGFTLTSENYVAGEAIVTTDEDYILPFSDARPVVLSDLFGFDAMTLKLARNEIYARYGRIFEDPYLQSYFESRDWYMPLYSADDFPESLLTQTEKENASFISSIEKELNQ
jgi:hypothetical protein